MTSRFLARFGRVRAPSGHGLSRAETPAHSKRLKPLRVKTLRFPGRSAQSGFALLLILFLLALVVISVAAVSPTVLASIQREKEADMVWRGKQYIRGIRMYYVKLHRFPTQLDDLTKPKTGLRFMRQAYKDPMNGSDGSWRLIYVGPNGQLIGSLKNRTIGGSGIGIPAGQAGTAFGSNAGFASTSTSGFGGNSTFNSGFGNNASSFGQSQSSFGRSAFNSSGFGNSNANSTSSNNSNPQGGAFSTAPADTSSASSDDPNAPSLDNGDLPPAAMQDAPTIMGGNIIGVGSKINRKSFLWYDKAKNYRLFEFIWDPSKDMNVGRASQGIGTPLQTTGQPNSPFGQNPSSPQGTGFGQNPQNPQTPPADQQNPPQNQNLNPDPNQNPPLQSPPPSNP